MIEILSFKPLERNTLRGFITVRLPRTDLKIMDCTLHELNEKRWVNLPARPFEDGQGNTQWVSIIKFGPEAHRKFQKETLAAFDNFIKNSDDDTEAPF